MAIEYQKGNSHLHNLDARTKLLLFVGITIASVIIIDPVIMGVLFLALYWLGRKAVDPKLLDQNLRVLVVIFLTFSLFQILFFTPKVSHFLFYLIPFTEYVPVTVEGLIRGVAVFFRFFSVVLAVHLMLYTTPPVELALTITEREKRTFSTSDIIATVVITTVLLVSFLPILLDPQPTPGLLAGLEPITRNIVLVAACLLGAYLAQAVLTRGLPPEMGLALTLGFSTVGILTTQTQKITDAQKARGYDVKPKNLVRRVQVLTALLIPIFMATMERSQDISIAILSRGFDYNIKARTFCREFAFQKQDYIFMAVIVAVILGGMLLNHFGIGNMTEQAVFGLIRQ
jgi:energy-coupling factor transporter transmembrane protein EcfT